MEKKKAYVKPSMESETFVPNAYCTNCGSGVTYWFNCNAGSTHSGDNVVYEESNGQPGLQRIGESWNPDHLRSMTYYACNDRHRVGKYETFLDGYIVQDNGWGEDDTITPVLIWTDHGTNTHCTTQLHPEDWEIAKS